MQEHQAKGGSVVVLDIDTGEVLAMVNQPAYNPNDRDQVAPRAIAIARPPTSSSPARASSRSSLPPASRPDAITRARSSTPRRASCASASRTFPTSTTSGRSRSRPCIAKSSNVGMTKMAMTLRAAVDAQDAARVRLRRSDRQRFSRRIGGTAVRRVALEKDRAGDDFLRLRTVGDAAAAGARLRDSRRRRNPPAGDAAARRRSSYRASASSMRASRESC